MLADKRSNFIRILYSVVNLGVFQIVFMSDEKIENALSSSWSDIPVEILSRVVYLGGNRAGFALKISQVCTSWRRMLETQRILLHDLHFGAVRTASFERDQELPLLLKSSIVAGNLEAQLLAAQHFHRIGDVVNEKRSWLLAAKNGHPEAQWMVGSGYYYGRLNYVKDSEEALMWLQRTIKSLSRVCDGDDPKKLNLPVFMTLAQCRSIYRKCCNIVGLMYLDGEAINADWSQSIKFLRKAELHGCEDAPQILVSMYRNGTY